MERPGVLSHRLVASNLIRAVSLIGRISFRLAHKKKKRITSSGLFVSRSTISFLFFFSLILWADRNRFHFRHSCYYCFCFSRLFSPALFPQRRTIDLVLSIWERERERETGGVFVTFLPSPFASQLSSIFSVRKRAAASASVSSSTARQKRATSSLSSGLRQCIVT